MTLPELAPLAWALLAVGAVIVGLSKTGVPGAGSLAVACFASALPARTSTGALLVLLIVGDLFALSLYRKDANWRTLLRLAPAVLAGVVLGAVFLALADDGGVRVVIGSILLALVALTVFRRFTAAAAPTGRAGTFAGIGYGTLGGFTTMVANAGGPVMSLYFLTARFEMRAFLGTAAWFFAVINIVKVPFSIGLGLITWSTLALNLVLIPAVLVGGFAGRWIAGRMRQSVFEWVVLALTVVGALFLIFA